MNAKDGWICLTIATIGGFLGYVSGLATQPILALIGAAVLAVGSLLLSLFQVAKLGDQEGLEHFKVLLNHAPQVEPARFFFGTLIFAVFTSVGVNVGIYQRTRPDQVDVSEEARIRVEGLDEADRVRLVNLLKDLHDRGYTKSERLFVLDANTHQKPKPLFTDESMPSVTAREAGEFVTAESDPADSFKNSGWPEMDDDGEVWYVPISESGHDVTFVFNDDGLREIVVDCNHELFDCEWVGNCHDAIDLLEDAKKSFDKHESVSS